MTTGPDDREVVVLLHSLGTDRRLWQHQVTALAGRYRVITPDSRGHGGTAWKGPLRLEDWVADLHAELASVSGEVHLVGLSMGGIQAVAYAERHPDRVRSLVLANTFATLAPEIADRRMETIGRGVSEQGMAGYAETYLGETLTRPLAAGDRAVLHDAIASVSAEAYLASSEVTFRVDNTGRLAGIGVPTLVLAGADDDKTPLPLSRELEHGIPGATLRVIPQAGHLSNIENPEAFTEALTTFFAAVGGERHLGKETAV
ncbi:alpha/beta fold hydrolase [Streptosporangium sp. CA-115845]|uniref:alpha/beta fold hydrolase n=1 Tax=Streptosporangium sp. CA-115845 TaxID=3240071 RepID=UPI003D9379AE